MYKNSGNPVLNTPSFETKDQAQKYLMTKMFANHQDFKVVHTTNVGVAENFKDGRHPEDKGDSKRYGVPTRASVSTLRKVAKQGGRKGQLAHWLANMKAGRNK